MKTNYKLIFDKEIEYVKTLAEKPKLLLHVCCAPCCSAVLEQLYDIFDITFFFYNPNISPESEFLFRLDELKGLASKMGLPDVPIVVPDYDEDEFYSLAEGLEHLPEGGARCEKCYRLRLSKSAEYAEKNGFNYMTTTLSISPYKNARLLNEIGLELEREYDFKYLCSDFKKGEGYKRSCELSRELGLYRQDYCGCIYSKRDAK